jgi:hypothetical protein
MAINQTGGQITPQYAQVPFQPSLQAIRTDPRIMMAAQSQYSDLEASQLGMGHNSNNKKARGLMRAGGESSKHLYTDWPHDYVLVGSDNERVFYKDLSIEQWSYGYVSSIERQNNPVVQKNMLSHLKDTYLDSMLYGFKRPKAFMVRYSRLSKMVG